jgi:ubiquinone/menaquinone biosynthesis C-methylase UbiE
MPMRTFRVLAIACVLVSGLVHPCAGQLAARPADEWIKVLDSPERVAGLRIGEIVAALHLQPGNVVADLGAGSGIFTVALARAVGDRGKVYAVDIDQKLLDYIAEKVKREGLGNVRTVLGQFADPLLPSADVDVAFMHDVLHHIEDKAVYLKQLVRYMAPSGRIAIVEPDARKGPHADDPKLQVTKEELDGWMSNAGFVRSEEIPLSEAKWYLIYRRK